MLGFIIELKSALTMVLVATSLAPLAGNVAINVGNVGLGTRAWPHPATRATNTKTSDDISRIVPGREARSTEAEGRYALSVSVPTSSCNSANPASLPRLRFTRLLSAPSYEAIGEWELDMFTLGQVLMSQHNLASLHSSGTMKA